MNERTKERTKQFLFKEGNIRRFTQYYSYGKKP